MSQPVQDFVVFFQHEHDTRSTAFLPKQIVFGPKPDDRRRTTKEMRRLLTFRYFVAPFLAIAPPYVPLRYASSMLVPAVHAIDAAVQVLQSLVIDIIDLSTFPPTEHKQVRYYTTKGGRINVPLYPLFEEENNEAENRERLLTLVIRSAVSPLPAYAHFVVRWTT